MAGKSTTKNAPKKAPPPKTATKPELPPSEFRLYAPEAQEVMVTGDFNNWDQEEHRAKRGKDGVWKKKIVLAPGRYEYLFLVDGQWWTDPENPATAENPFGTVNSVREI